MRPDIDYNKIAIRRAQAIEVMNTKEFKDFTKRVAEYTRRSADSVSITRGYILVDGYKYKY